MLPLILALLFIAQAWAAWTALAFYSLAAFTDFLDGYLARSMNQESALGQFMDPIADKVFIATLLIALVGFDRLEGLWMIAAIVILAREFLIAGLREFLGPQNIQLPVTKLAKWKTTIQMIALGFLIIGDFGDSLLPHTLVYGQVGITLAAFLTAITGWVYLKEGLRHIADMEAK